MSPRYPRECGQEVAKLAAEAGVAREAVEPVHARRHQMGALVESQSMMQKMARVTAVTAAEMAMVESQSMV